MRVNPDWLSNPSLQRVMKALEDAGYEAYTVGGCVRDAVAERPANDVDVATNARPDDVKRVLKSAGLKLYPTGVEHGTWTVGKGKDTFEVTTYRFDVSTDGRRATVDYADTMEQDAARRDFTMNALYMDRTGQVFDPVGTGVEDARSGTVRFVGDANARCREDYLRILRLFRFYALYGRGGMDTEAMCAAAANKDGLAKVSGERVWSEVKKLLGAKSPSSAVAYLNSTEVATMLWKKPVDCRAMFKLVHEQSQQGAPVNWYTRYAALAGYDIPWPAAKAERAMLERVKAARASDKPLVAKAVMFGREATEAAEWLEGRPVDPVVALELRTAQGRVVPVTGADFKALGVPEGKVMEACKRRATEFWLNSALTASKDACLRVGLEEVAWP